MRIHQYCRLKTHLLLFEEDTLTPFIWMVLTALKTKSESISVNPFYIFPAHGWHWENFVEVWNSYNFLLLYRNSGRFTSLSGCMQRETRWKKRYTAHSPSLPDTRVSD